MGASGSSLLKGMAKFIGKNGAKAGAHVAGGLANNMGSVVPAVFLLNMSGKLIEFIEDEPLAPIYNHPITKLKIHNHWEHYLYQKQ